MPLSTVLSEGGLAGFSHLLNKEVEQKERHTCVKKPLKSTVFLLLKNAVWTSLNHLNHLVSQIIIDS